MLKFSVQASNIHIISPLDVSLGSKYASGQRLSTLKNKTKSVENKAMLKSMSMLNDRLQSLTKGISKFS